MISSNGFLDLLSGARQRRYRKSCFPILIVCAILSSPKIIYAYYIILLKRLQAKKDTASPITTAYARNKIQMVMAA